MNSTSVTVPEKQLTKPGKLAWQLLLSVIIIFCLSFARHSIEFVISVFNFYTNLLIQPHNEGFNIAGLIGAFFYFWLIKGLLNRKQAFRILAFVQIAFSLLIFGSLLISAFINEAIDIGFGIENVFIFQLNKIGIIVYSTSLFCLQLYKAYVLPRKDVHMLFKKPREAAQ